jgi:hypothetical protein
MDVQDHAVAGLEELGCTARTFEGETENPTRAESDSLFVSAGHAVGSEGLGQALGCLAQRTDVGLGQGGFVGQSIEFQNEAQGSERRNFAQTKGDGLARAFVFGNDPRAGR